MSRRTLHILYICLLVIPVYGQRGEDVFDENIEAALDKVIALNDAKNFLEAYRQISLAEKSVDASLRESGNEPSALSDWEFANRYWPVKKSKAEIAYMLGIYTDMEAASKELWQSIGKKQWDQGTSEYEVNGLKASIAKIDGSRYYLTEKYDSAETALNWALQLGDFPRSDDFVCKVHDDLAQLYYKQEKFDLALAHLDTILASLLYQKDSRNKETEQNIKTVQSQRAICLARLGRYSEALKEIESVVQYFKTAQKRPTYGRLFPKGLKKRLFAEALRKKAKIMMLQYDATGKYSSEAIACYRQYLAISKDYIDQHFVNMSESEREQYWMAEQPFVTDCFRLEDKAPGLLYDVAIYGKAVLLQMGRDFKEGMTVAEKKRALAAIRVSWQQVRDKLPHDGCAIEFVVYEKKGESHIGALVLNKRSVVPKFVHVSSVAAIRNYPLTAGLDVKKVLGTRCGDSETFWLYNNDGLKTLIWNTQLTHAIGACRQVMFSPDGILHQLAIEYMAPKDLADKQFYRLTSTRLLSQPRRPVQTGSMLICSGIDYRSSVSDDETGNDVLAYRLLASKENIRLNPLAFSEREADSIAAIRHRHPFDRVLRADSVTEAALHQLLGKYNIVHISTHGLFADISQSGTDIRPSSSDTQLSKSCLFLSGSEKKLQQPHFDASRHDGVMSARELAKLDMHDVDLTVLSACMSGLGYITIDGMFGLQRALKTAGARAVISTLWEVDDDASCYFVLCLYSGLEAGLTLHDAFLAARQNLRSTGNAEAEVKPTSGSFMQRWKNRKYNTRNFNKPYFYNAFILTDGME